MSLEDTKKTALYVLGRHARDELTAAARFVAPMNHGLYRMPILGSGPYADEQQEMHEWAAALERELAIVVKGPVFDHFKRRVEKATSVDEVNRLMHCVTGMGERSWQKTFTSMVAAKHITNAGRCALTDPSTDLCRRRLQREFTELQ